MKISGKQHKAISFILFLSLLVLLRLGTGEVQPWDEGLYAVRAKAVVEFGNVWDQTQHTLGGLYSSTCPPLSVWAMSAFMSTFGQDAFSIRLFAALCSVLSLLMMYLIARRIVSYEQSLMAVFLLAANLHWNNFARQGMTDVPLVLFFLVTLWAVLKVREAITNKDTIIYSAVYALAFAAALMTKITVSFLPLLFLIFLYLEHGKKKYYLTLAAVAGIALASPWYIYMSLHHGAEFYRALFAPHVYSVVETNTQHLGPFYYLNQLFISNAFVLLSFIMLVLAFSKKIRNAIIVFDFENNKDKYLFYTITLWFGLSFFALSFSMTKMLHYSLYMLPPAVILAVVFYENIQDIIKNKRLIILIFSAIAVILIWSFSFSIRQDIKSLFTLKEIALNAIIYLLISISLLSSAIFLKKSFLDKKLFDILPKFVYTMIIILLLRIVVTNMMIETGHSYGARHIGDLLEEKNAKSFVYLYHATTPADSLNPQLAWYTNYMMLNWYKDKTYKPVSLSPATFRLSELTKLNLYPDDFIVYYLPDDRNISILIIEKIQMTRPLLENSKRYVLFGKQFAELRHFGKPI